MKYTFVSYSHKDSDFVKALVKDLADKSIPVWLDSKDIQIGEEWDEAIGRALRDASHLLLVLSKASIQSKHVRDELNFAKEERKKIIPIVIGEVKLPYNMRRPQYIDFRGNYAAGLTRLVEILPQGDTRPLRNLFPDNEKVSIINRVLSKQPVFVFPEDNSRKRLSNPMLIFRVKGMEAREWVIHPDYVTIGRSNRCDIVITNMKISRQHLRIMHSHGEYFLRDLKSKNGTWINNQTLSGQTKKLSHGDKIELARVISIDFLFPHSVDSITHDGT